MSFSNILLIDDDLNSFERHQVGFGFEVTSSSNFQGPWYKYPGLKCV